MAAISSIPARVRVALGLVVTVALAGAPTLALAQARAATPTLPGVADDAPDLGQLVERAWEISRRGRLTAARGEALAARGRATESPFAGAPTVGLDWRRDLPSWAGLPGTDTARERGRNELEPGIAAPVWLPGQRDAQRRVIDRERGQLDATAREERLRIAGEVREAVWAVAIARGERRVQEARRDAARALAADVERRVQAGDLAPSDRMMATTELLAAQAAVDEAQAAVDAALAVLNRLTGSPRAGDVNERVAATIDADAHPALAATREAIDVNRERLALVRATRRENPTVSAAARFDRDVYGGAYRNTVRFGVAIPLDTDARNAPRIATASADLTEAEIVHEQRRREIAGEIDRARIALDAATRAFDTQRERATVARDLDAAIDRAFRAGERALPELLRVRAQTLDAELAREIASARLGRAVARLNQALGVQP